ncbi:CGNR zinc finger domain-containing protein [Peribacillus sp. NJ4]|uniref:CGNR zinc finger domain-containing protein n=1 Tax=unclassified Peribacillus TaxID=2675266 RepID=UPI0025A17502|nr:MULTISPECIES: CGNR zinc finger domain-containing protein [unclassified Peribacillus]MDM5213107.1 CGNR zinc finger domain-containing protein [Peribacillus sp. NJ4]MDM5223480.1 CGNR zinc finger domain-containing protein [Peribacillus sp. NJ11]
MSETNKFPLISGYLSLDLVNTELVSRGQRQDLLLSEGDALDWIQVIKGENSFWDDQLILKIKERIGQVLESILEMRTILRIQFESIADGNPIPDEFIAFLEKKIKKSPFTYKLMDQKLIAIPVGEAEDILQAYIAFDSLSLIEENKLSSLKRCSNDDCVLLFIDESGRRKWCSMKICGNRKKVARFQHRKSDDE